MASDGKILPMEFTVVPTTYVTFMKHFSSRPYIESLLIPLIGTDTVVPRSDFLSDFASVLTSDGCDGLFGIDTLANGDWTEMNVGNASVVVPSNDSDDYNKEEFISVAFAFNEEKSKFRVHGRCGKGNHKHTSIATKPKKVL